MKMDLEVQSLYFSNVVFVREMVMTLKPLQTTKTFS